ncbi:flagellar hook-length control protein FliK [Helicobacter pylori]|uniref:Flagellar hook-length control protein-like C-terminal domain-containing protein n=1 Tax=Helicobacter pylori (strain B8) TaxID=693745 RepID=D7FDE6_HELP3|nr:flagellar hook-length control protein FliK [Helicobacter pylori]AVG79578.1 flagellar hook-length control protein FliK [Helicobacter pylori]AVG81050.1 flagellar hook-length control protein FliK [Helicobacter pylori]AVG83893.1 flagellar hook-length control protein FliK [Helicobacter pylori]AVG85333.1 flagellar hook-length control protein FliK [Helicobacter pylori]AVG86816.1 flagellar hook-length control protein FliK [Helicobacter pylori]
MPSPINPIHTNANANANALINSGAKNEDTKNAPKSASKDFSKILNQKISKDKTAPKEDSNASKVTPKDAKEDAKALEKTPTLPHQHAQNPAKDQQAPTLKDWLNHKKTTVSHEAQHETHEANETNPKTPNETLNKNEKKPNGVTSNAHQTNLASKNPITPNHANNAIKNPTTPTHSAKEPKTLKDIQTLSQKHDLNASNIQATTTPENKNPLNASDHLALKTTQTPTNHTLAKNDAKNTANLSSVLQSLEKKEPHNKEHANPQNNEKKTPPLKEALPMNAIKRDKTLSKKKSEKTQTKAQTTAPSIATENAPKIPLKTPPLMPLTGANPPPNNNAPTLLEKEETTKEASDNKEKTKESSNSAQSAQNAQSSDKTSENKSAAPKETIKHFTQQLKQEIQEYKPPMSRISMDLFPKELGKVEVVIQKVGKNLKVSVISHNNSLQTFLDNQQDLKNSLNALGFEGVDLSFSQDSSKEQPKEQLRELFKEQESSPLKENALKSYQENTDHENQETSMQITLYA